MTTVATNPTELPAGARRVALVAVIGGAGILALKFALFAMTGSAALLADALESIVNLVAALMALISTWYAARPADREHPYGHGNVEFFAVGVEGLLIVLAGATSIFEAARRFSVGAEPRNVTIGFIGAAVIAVLMTVLGAYVWRGGRRYDSPTLVADGKHLLTDVASTVAVVAGLVLVRFTGQVWLDAVVAAAIGIVIFLTGGRLLLASWRGLMDQIDPADDADIRAILDAHVESGHIRGYHKVRHRHAGSFHWVDLHVQLEGDMTVRQAHEAASAIEHEIERHLGRANATVHVEPPEAA